MKYKLILSVLLTFLVIGFVLITRNVESTVEVSEENPQKIVVTIGEPSDADENSELLAEANSLRIEWKLMDAIPEYQKVVDMPGIDPHLRAEAQYCVGLCWLYHDHEKAEQIFQEMLVTYDGDGEAVANVRYCLAWLDIQRGEYQKTIENLRAMLADKTCNDTELYARTQYLIGKTYRSFLNDNDTGRVELRKVLTDYPDSEAAKYSSLDYLR